jgi:hypothetical protein
MKIFASLILILSTAALASAATIQAFSVDNVIRVKDNLYTAEKYVVDTHGEPNAGDILGRYITFKTEGCLHNPGANVSAIYLRTPQGDKIIFSDGGACRVDVVQSDDKTPTPAKK